MIGVFRRSTVEGWWETAEGAVCDAMEGGKRLASSDGRDAGALVVAKKQKREDDKGEERTVGEKKGIRRTSKLDAPTMLLTGHQDEIFGIRFSPDGQVVATGSKDKHVFLWNVYEGCSNFMVLKGHKNAILELSWTTDGEKIVTASADKTARLWDVEIGAQIKTLKGHAAIVNSCSPARRGPPLVATCADDGTAKLWDLRVKGAEQTFQEKFPLTSVAFSDAGDKLYTGGLKGVVGIWDTRKNEYMMELGTHQDIITGLSVSADGTHLLSNSMDGSLKAWDIRPYAEGDRCTRTFTGHAHGFEQNLLRCAWSPDGSRVTCGSSDCLVYVWDYSSGKLVYRLPGHSGSVNEVVFHPLEPIVGSCSSDRQIYLGEIEED